MKITRLTFMVLLAALTISVQAETVNCTPITSLPATITTQGNYCLTGHLVTSKTSGNAITISANYVTLDLNGWQLSGISAGTGTQAIGIFSTANGVTIKNGIVRGFYVGIQLGGSGDVVRDVLADTNYSAGIYTTGPDVQVEHNQVLNTGGSNYPSGIVTQGTGATISDNIIQGVTSGGTGDAWGIAVFGANSTVRNNVVSNSALPSSGTSYGIYNGGGIVLNNAVSTFTLGVENSSGIYAYNTVNSCTTPFIGGTAGAGNSST